MKLNDSQLEKLHARNLANIVQKLRAGGTLTAREERLLQEARAGTAEGDKNFVWNWGDLAHALGRSRRCLIKWREKFKDLPDFPKQRDDGRHDVAAWLKFMADHQLADEADDEDEDTEFSKGYWDRRRSRLDFERGLYGFEVEKEKHLPIDEITAAVGQMLAGFRTALNTLPTSAARWVKGMRDFNSIKNKLQEEVDAVLQALGRCDYLQELTASVVAQMFPERDESARADLVLAVDSVYRELGRLALSDLLQRALPISEAPAPSGPPTPSHTPASTEKPPPRQRGKRK